MQALETMKSKGQAGIKQLVTLGKEQSESVKTWGVTVGAAVAGGLALRVGAPGLVAILRTLAPLPVSLTVGALVGGVLGWRYLERQKTATRNATAAGREPAAVWTAPATPVPVALDRAAVSDDQPATALPLAADTHELVAPLIIEVADDAGTVPVAADVAPADVAIAAPADEPLPTSAAPASESGPMIDAAPVSEPPVQQDNLADIVGIGPVFAAHLQDAGIHTFVQLAALHPEQLEEIMAPSRGGQMINAADWIAQAGRLAESTTA